jgi:effector-binding domain-containing protein
MESFMQAATDLEFAEVQVTPAVAVQLCGHCATDPASIGNAMRSAFETVMGYVTDHGLALTGPPRAIYTAYDAGGVSFMVALPVAAGPNEPAEPSAVFVGRLPGVHAYRFTHHGPYANMPQAYGQITAFLKGKGILRSDADWARHMPMWEEYQNDPAKTAAADLVTYIYLPAAETA